MTPAQVVAGFWDALYSRDWDRVAGCFGAESLYWDVPVGPTAAARGPDDIVARLRLGLDPLDRYEHDHLRTVSEGATVVTEHTETWHWPSGEKVTLPFVSVQVVDHDVVALWKDYWDQQTLMAASPQWWRDRLAAADLSWIHDATGVR
jgi:limonene-1,2-epoxide hydrolase